MDYEDEDSDRVLVEQIEGAPEGMGIYELPNGTREFFTCAPGETYDPPNHDDFYEVINEETGEIQWDKEDPMYRTVKNVMKMAGRDISEIKTEAQLDHILSNKGLGYRFMDYIDARRAARKPKTLYQAMVRAQDIGDEETYKRLMAKLRRIKEIGLTVITGKPRETDPDQDSP